MLDRCAGCPHRQARHHGTPPAGCAVSGCTCTGWEPARRLGLPIPSDLQPSRKDRYCPHPTMVLGETCPLCTRVVGSAEDVAIGKGA